MRSICPLTYTLSSDTYFDLKIDSGRNIELKDDFKETPETYSVDVIC